jgi:hypothetical protein
MRTQNNLVSEYDLLIAGCEQEREARAFSLGPSLHKNQAENHLFSTKIEFFVILQYFGSQKLKTRCVDSTRPNVLAGSLNK